MRPAACWARASSSLLKALSTSRISRVWQCACEQCNHPSVSPGPGAYRIVLVLNGVPLLCWSCHGHLTVDLPELISFPIHPRALKAWKRTPSPAEPKEGRSSMRCRGVGDFLVSVLASSCSSVVGLQVHQPI